jgi:hypothetical protein
MNTHNTASQFNASAAVLWASAFIIAALVVVQAGRLPGNLAHGDMVADRSSYTLMTADSGRGGDVEPDEILLIIDSREQILLVYEVEDARKRNIFLRDSYSLDNLFMRARQ